MKLLLTLLALLLPMVGYGEDFSLAIVVPMKDGIRTIRFDTTKHEPFFHVVLTNTSGKEQRIWESWNSWGYYNLSFELTGADGKMVKVERGPRGWTRNFRSYLTMKPGEANAFDVRFPDDWSNLPNVAKKEVVAKLRAVFPSQRIKIRKFSGCGRGRCSRQRSQ